MLHFNEGRKWWRKLVTFNGHMTELNKFLIGIHKARWKSLSKKKIHFLFKMRAEYTNMVLGGECLSTYFAYFYILYLLFKDCQEFRNKRIIHKVINRGGFVLFRAKLNILQFAIETIVEDASFSGDIPLSWRKSKLIPVQCQELRLEIQWFQCT